MTKPRRFRTCADERALILNLIGKRWTDKEISDFMKRDVRTVARQRKLALAKKAPKRRKTTAKQAQMARRRHAVTGLARQTETRNGKTRPKFATAGAISNELNRLGLRCSRWTIRRDLIKEHFVVRVRTTIPTTQAGDRKRRRLFCKDARHWAWEHLVFDDEKVFTVNDCGSRTMWVAPGRAPLGRETKRFAVRVMVWAAISKDTLVWYIVPNLTAAEVAHERKVAYAKRKNKPVPAAPTAQQKKDSDWDEYRLGSVTSDNYTADCLQLLLPHFRANPSHRFIQDGAKAHTSAHTRKWMDERKINYTTNWPARSPDLNPIETLWAHVARMVSNLFPQNLMELCSAIHQAMNTVKGEHMDLVNNLCKSFPRRADEVFRANGNYSL